MRLFQGFLVASLAATIATALHAAPQSVTPETGTGGYTAACPVVIDSTTGLPAWCPPPSSGFAVASGGGSLVFGSGQASGAYSIVVGSGAGAASDNSIAIGARSLVTSLAPNAVAIGADSIANEANTVSFGSGFGNTRRLVNIAPGINLNDAVNVNQVVDLAAGAASWIGGGAGFTASASGSYSPIAPTFNLYAPVAQGSYNTVSSALSALDNSLSTLYNTVANQPPGSGSQGPAGPTGPTGPQGPQGPAGNGNGNGTDSMAVHYDDSQRSSVTLAGANGTQIHNVNAGTEAHDAVNVSQLEQAAADALASSKQYTDVSSSKTLQSANEYTDWRMQQVDDRLRRQDTRINRAGAVASAMGVMAGTAASVQNDDVLSMGVAGYRSESAMSVGLNHHFNDRVAVTIGAAFSGGNESSVGAGLAIGLH